jgi:hypothetical protein
MQIKVELFWELYSRYGVKLYYDKKEKIVEYHAIIKRMGLDKTFKEML